MESKDYEKLITWGLRRQLTWSVLILTFISVSIELFFRIDGFTNISIESILFLEIVFLHTLFFFGFLYSLCRFFKLYNIVNDWEEQLPQEIKKQIVKTYGWHHKIITCNSQRKSIYVIIFVVWLVAIISKLLVIFKF